MEKTVKSCYKCKSLFIVYVNSFSSEFCKYCRTLKQKETELELVKYMQNKYAVKPI